MSLRSEGVVYQAPGVTLRGFVAWDPGKKEKRPGVLVVHEWWGHDEYVRGRAEQLGGAGYVAMAVDMYGDGKTAQTPDEAGKLMMQVLGDPKRMRARFEAARDVLIERDGTDAARIAAIGYCFGGAVVLHMARIGLDLKAVAAFHPGSLATTRPAKRGLLKAKVLACLGAADPFVGKDEREAFRREMSSAGADFELVEYPGVQHGFTVPAATERGKKYGLPLAHDAKADRDSWSRLERLLQRALA
jgi:dienelactone hydrolase